MRIAPDRRILCRNYLTGTENERTLKVMMWPLQSPGLNPIEVLWDEVGREENIQY